MIHQLSLMLSYRIGGDGGGDYGEVEWDCFRVINVGIERSYQNRPMIT